MLKRITAMIAVALIVLLSASAVAATPIRTYLTFRVTTLAQRAVVNVGEDLQIEVGVSGVEPYAYRWYFAGSQIADADERVYNLINAQMEDAGKYRMDAFDEAGNMLLSIEVNVRVIDPTILPASGDDSLPVSVAFVTLAMGLTATGALIYKRKSAER